MYLSSFMWAGREEPLLVGTNKEKLRRAARDKAIKKENGTGPIDRGSACCSVKITLDDIRIREIEVL